MAEELLIAQHRVRAGRTSRSIGPRARAFYPGLNGFGLPAAAQRHHVEPVEKPAKPCRISITEHRDGAETAEVMRRGGWRGTSRTI